MMHRSARGIVFLLCILCILTRSTVGTGRYLNEGSIYFPDQAEYVKLSLKCPDNTVLWPSDRRCYREGEQGPCNIGRVIVLDKVYLKPKCKDTFPL